MPLLSDNDVNLDNNALNVCFNSQVPPPLIDLQYVRTTINAHSATIKWIKNSRAESHSHEVQKLKELSPKNAQINRMFCKHTRTLMKRSFSEAQHSSNNHTSHLSAS